MTLGTCTAPWPWAGRYRLFALRDGLGRQLRLALLCVSCLSAAAAVRPLCAQEASLFSELTQRGLAFSDEQRVRLSPPTLGPDMSASERTEVLHKLAGRLGWERFSRDAVTAPVVVDIDTIDGPAGERLGLRVHNAFIAYTTLETLGDRELMEEIFGAAPVNQAPAPEKSNAAATSDVGRVVMQEISQADLERLGLSEQAHSAASFAYIELPLLNKVLLRGVIRIEKRQREGALEFAWRFDPSFNSVEKYASRWTRLERDAVGKLIEGASLPYSGCGGWMGVYQIDVASKQLLVESQMLLREPTEWFAGSNFLRSKLPLTLQENARSFRRKIAAAR